MKRQLNAKINEDWDLSNEGKEYSEEEDFLVNGLNVYKRGSLERQIETIKLASKLKRRYKAIYNHSIGHGGNRPNRNCQGVDWELENAKKPYSIEEMILMSKIALHKRAPQGSVTDLAVQYGRTPWAVTVKISQLRKSGEWKNWLEVEKKKLARV